MNLLGKMNGVKIPAFKELTKDKPVCSFVNPEYVYIPLANHTNTKCDALVEVGDKVYKGQVVGERNDHFKVPIFSSISGEVVEISKQWHKSGIPVNSIVIKNDMQETWHEDIKDEASPEELTSDEIIEKIQVRGLVGLGGSGFASYVKYKGDNDIDTIVLNGAECEPYITADYRLILEHAEKIVDGMKFMIKASNAKKGVIAIKKNKPKIIKRLEEVIKNDDNLELLLLEDVYPSGWERYIIEEAMGRKYDRLPSECGIIANNTGTAYAVSEAVRYNRPVIERYVTFSGEGFKHPQNVYLKIGTKIKDVIEEMGGYSDGLEQVVLASGGPMMPTILRNDEMVISQSVNSILCLPHVEKVEETTCMRCGTCINNCPSGVPSVLLKDAAINKQKDLLKKLNVHGCIQCGLCTYVCPSGIEVANYIKTGKRLAK